MKLDQLLAEMKTSVEDQGFTDRVVRRYRTTLLVDWFSDLPLLEIVGLLILVVSFGSPSAWALFYSSIGAISDFTFDIENLGALGAILVGELIYYFVFVSELFETAT